MYMVNGYPTNISTKSYRGILRTYLWYFGGCRQIPTEKNVSGSKLCRRDGGILAKSDDIWLSGRHVADMSATFSAKSAIPGPGRSLKHSHGTFYRFVCFAPSRRAGLALFSI